MLLPIKNTLLMVILSVGLTIAQNQTSENDCSWSQSTPNCKEYQKHFDPLPSVTKQKGRGEFHRVDPLQRMQDGLNCLAYDVLVSPKEAAGDKTDPMKVNISVQVLELEELDPHKQELELEKSLTLTWIDWRLKWPAKCNESHNYYIDISKTYPLLWQPLLRYVGMRSQESQGTVSLKAWYPATGQVTIEQTFTERHACKANLHWYPFDAINCEMIHVLDSKMGKAVLQKSNKDENSRNFLAGWTILSEESHLNETTKGVINHSTLVYQFRFKREVSSEVMQTFLPSLMLSIASSSSLYISFDQLPARMGLCATTFLALIALFKGSSNDWPKTAELKAIDLWTILCYAGAFFCLVEYSMILYLSRQKVNSVKDGLKNSGVASRKLHKIEKYAKIIITIYTFIYPILFFAVCLVQE